MIDVRNRFEQDTFCVVGSPLIVTNVTIWCVDRLD